MQTPSETEANFQTLFAEAKQAIIKDKRIIDYTNDLVTKTLERLRP
jgi:hypothetical protein